MGTQPNLMAGTGSPVSHDQPTFLTTNPDSAEPSVTKLLCRRAPTFPWLAGSDESQQVATD